MHARALIIVAIAGGVTAGAVAVAYATSAARLADGGSAASTEAAWLRLTAVSAMSTPRAAHQATRLHDGQVLVTGGCSRRGCEGFVASAELYEPARRSFVAAPPMRVARASHTATLLPDGRVLVAGGFTPAGVTASTEIYDPGSRRWSAGPDMAAARGSHVAIPLEDGSVFMTGGGGRVGAEIFDPATGTFTPTQPSPARHYLATRLADGTVLLTGGQGPDREVLSAATVFDPRTGSYRPVGDMLVPRVKHGAALLPDGRVLLVGGSDERGYRERFSSTEYYDPATRTFSAGPVLGSGRHKLRDAIVSLPSGGVVVAAGAAQPELWDPGSRRFQDIDGELGGAQMFATATVLDGEHVLVLGGYDERIAPSASAWLVRGRNR